MFADAFADKEPAPNFDGNQGIQTSFANGEVFPWSFGCTTDQITETWNASNSDQRKCLEMLIHDRTRMLLSISSSPALIAGISLSFGGVISAAAYLPTIFKTGRDFTAKATMKKVKKNEFDQSELFRWKQKKVNPFFPLDSTNVTQALHYVISLALWFIWTQTQLYSSHSTSIEFRRWWGIIAIFTYSKPSLIQLMPLQLEFSGFRPGKKHDYGVRLFCSYAQKIFWTRRVKIALDRRRKWFFLVRSSDKREVGNVKIMCVIHTWYMTTQATPTWTHETRCIVIAMELLL